MVPLASPEYGATLDSLNRDYAGRIQHLSQYENFEAQGPPLYYAVAAAWYKLGAILGIHSGPLAYWVRFLNPLFYGLLVWLSYCFVRRVHPENDFLCVAVPALLAVFPQDVFFGMNRDVLSPTLWAGALLLMVDAVAGARSGARSMLLASLLVGLGFLLELSNCVLYVALLSALWSWLHHGQTSVRNKIRVTSLSVTAAFLPPFLWMRRNYVVMGNLTGTRAKLEFLGWTMKPLREMLHHPLFHFDGFRFFVRGLISTFWFGEYRWHDVLMRSVSADRFYVVSTLVFLLIFALNFGWNWRTMPSVQRWVDWQALLAVAGSVLFLAAMSLAFDYHNSGYPSSVHPFFVSGRIISGVLLPFTFLYAGGLETLTERSRRWIPAGAVLACLLLFITVSEIRVRSVVFSSPYNFFAIESRR